MTAQAVRGAGAGGRGTAARSLCLALAALLSGGCPDDGPMISRPAADPPRKVPPGAPPLPQAPLLRGQPVASEFIEIDFPTAYGFLATTLFTEAQQSLQWGRFYRGRWVRLTGQLRAFSTNGLQFLQMEDSRTYEVELLVTQRELLRLREVLALGRFYNYVGRLYRVDAMVRVFLLEQGVVLGPNDVGVPGYLGPSPDLSSTSRPVPPPPRPWDVNTVWGPMLRPGPDGSVPPLGSESPSLPPSLPSRPPPPLTSRPPGRGG